MSQKFNIEGIPCADNAIDVNCYGHNLHIIFLKECITILTNEPIRKVSKVKDVQGFKKMIDLEYENKPVTVMEKQS